MSVRLDNVTKVINLRGAPHRLFDGLNLEIDDGERVAVLGLPKSGKTTLLQVICGTARLDGGRIRRDMSISWPIPLINFIWQPSSLAWNIRSVARMYGVKGDDFPDRVAELGGFTKFLNLPLGACPPFVRQQLGFALGIAMDFDLYLFDNQIVPQRKEFKEEAFEHFQERTAGKAVLLATGKAQWVAGEWDSAYVLERGQLTRFPEVKECLEYFKSLEKAEAERQKAMSEDQDVYEGGEGAESEESDRSVEVVAAVLSDL